MRNITRADLIWVTAIIVSIVAAVCIMLAVIYTPQTVTASYVYAQDDRSGLSYTIITHEDDGLYAHTWSCNDYVRVYPDGDRLVTANGDTYSDIRVAPMIRW